MEVSRPALYLAFAVVLSMLAVNVVRGVLFGEWNW